MKCFSIYIKQSLKTSYIYLILNIKSEMRKKPKRNFNYLYFLYIDL